jgi:hypothetical protein
VRTEIERYADIVARTARTPPPVPPDALS